MISKIILLFTSKVILLSKSEKKLFKKLFRNTNFFVLENTIETEYDFGEKKKRKGKTRFIYISNYIKEKGIFELLKVFSELSKSNDNIVLETYGEFTNEEDKAKILSYDSDKIRINGQIIGQKKMEKIFKSDCLVLPSYNEGQPLILLEAMSVGTDIISSKVGTISEMVGEDYKYFVLPQNEDSLKNAFLNYLNVNDNANGSYLQQKYYSKFSKLKHSKKVLEIFN
ncbi:MAG: glycosyltransferase [Melioribacteraceae bacterium]|nr:glycosyltransferase [Melioribacteraceae bacterium]